MHEIDRRIRRLDHDEDVAREVPPGRGQDQVLLLELVHLARGGRDEHVDGGTRLDLLLQLARRAEVEAQRRPRVAGHELTTDLRHGFFHAFSF